MTPSPTANESPPKPATLDDLMKFEGKAELVAGRIVPLSPTGLRPGRVSARICRALEDYEEETGVGMAVPDNVSFYVPELPSGRRSFSPDVAYYFGPMPTNEFRFVDGKPDFAVEIRSENDYGRAAEIAMAKKRAEYFEAGAQVVWDVDLVAKIVRVFRSATPDQPTIYGAGDDAEAEPALPGWRIAVDRIMAPTRKLP
ncbi:MAG: Uma2 family endonuclease [Planctomycetia bacterium]